MKQYLDLMRHVRDHGTRKEDRTGTGTVSVFGHQARFDLAVALAGRGQKAEAVEHLLHIVQHERSWNEEAARKQLVQFFDAWGFKDPATVDGRRRLSSLLFS